MDFPVSIGKKKVQSYFCIVTSCMCVIGLEILILLYIYHPQERQSVDNNQGPVVQN